MPTPLSLSELLELQTAFSDVFNYDAEDICSPIDPLKYKAPDNDNCLHIAALRGNVRAVELLLKAGLEINAIGDMGYTPLHYASTPETVALLLAYGASSDIKNEFGKSPLGWSAKS